MQIVVSIPRGAVRLAKTEGELSTEGRRRLKWMEHYLGTGRNARLTCRHFDISPQTFYRWFRRYNAHDLSTLEERTRRPHKLRRPTWSVQQLEAVRSVRQQYPRWGKDKLVVLLRQAGWNFSTSMVGRILKELKRRGILIVPIRSSISARKVRAPRPYAVRKPKEYQPQRPGDLVEVDTLDVRPLPGIILKHFTARDVVSRWDVVEVHSRATATTAASFLDSIQARMPFAVRAIQVDGGSEFRALFESECQRRKLRLFVLPPSSPKLNGHVERANRTHTEEFYEVWPVQRWTVEALNIDARAWETVYNTIRPHQSLAYRTPKQFLQDLHHENST